MFGFSLAAQLFQGSAQRTWNCVTQFTNQLWYKFNYFRYPVMPRSRRRHHSRSRSRSRSHSHDRDRDAKRRKIDNVDSPSHKRSVSSEPDTPEELSLSQEEQDLNESEKSAPEGENPIKHIEEKLTITPKKTLSPKQLQKKVESEKKRQQKQLEREERERKKQEEKERLRLEKEQMKKEKEELKNKKNEQKAKEREMKEEQKRKEKEEKEAKRKEKEEREEAKRKEREQEKLRKQQELEEKNREKQKIEEQKQKAAQAFVNFFVPKKTDVKMEEGKSGVEEGKTSMFMPFEVKSDMRLAPARRAYLSEQEKEALIEKLDTGEGSYLKELKEGKSTGKWAKTWPYEEDVIIVEEDVGESICEDKQKLKIMRVKFLKFHENKRPPYYGTWRKKSAVVNPRRPFGEDKCFFDYEVDSDDDWEEEEQGESLNGSDDEEKENEAENDDYEVDNDFFVPHGHLSDDEVDDEESAKLSPESHKQKLKLLKDEFDQDMQTKTNRMKPRSIGCIWYNKDRSNVDDAIDRHLRPLAMITNGHIIINKRKEFIAITPNRKYNTKELRQELLPAFLKLIHGNVNKRTTVVEEFMNYMRNNGHVVEVSKAYLGKCLKQYAQWKKCADEGPLLNKYCWCLEDDVKKKYNLE
ncbi:chromatin assembly factor 1 subunit A-like isoform X1 [Zophobas morio]|uniref:chromatin assembly factor 1 subunit A-like isoform X1 n=1 Tax=Zophobas morio TaxID=2755281 RepID=UPI003082DCE2